jgi:hypothetical protein
LVEYDVPFIIKIFNEWKHNKAYPQSFFDNKDNPIKREELLKSLQKINKIYEKKFGKQFSDDSELSLISSEESSDISYGSISQASSEGSSPQLSPPPSYHRDWKDSN